MKFKKTLSLLLSAVLTLSAASIAANAASVEESVGATYYNKDYLETEAGNAYNETGLGSTYSANSTTWKTWSPGASAVKVKLYRTGSDKESGAGVLGEHSMTKNSTTGVWSLTLTGDYKNVYYTYLVTVDGRTNETQDVYSKATGVNGNRSMVVDLDSTDPDGWSTDKHVLFNNAQEAVVWEVHVRDFSISDTSGTSSENMGKYLAFTEGGTTLNGQAGGISTTVDYLVEQGINCVQLMPVYDFQSVDEAAGASSTNRNWGYDPQNYNVPEGSYSSNPYDGNVRITEFKQMIQALHDRGISVVMDVVYNHTYTSDGSCFSRTVPRYYYRMTSGSAYSNGSGCGNETASDKKMYRKYMIESVKYWASEYHIDGFRFDLMALHDVQTLNDIRSGLDGLYSDGSGRKILMYGEPWTGGDTLCPDQAKQDRASSLSERVGMFNDNYRDGIKGDTDSTGKGFVQGNTDYTGRVVSGVKGKSFSAKAPSQTIAYADAHDNLILWDKIVKSNGSSTYTGTNAAYQAQVREVMTLLLTSQGIPFMTAGSEFGRTKKGDHNSYKSSDSVNAIDWNRVSKLSGLASYYKGLLQIRKNFAPLKSSSFSTPTFQSEWGDVVAYTYSNSTSGQWSKLCVLVNGGSSAWPITLSDSGWTVVANDSGAGLTSRGTVSGNSYTIGAKSAAILVKGTCSATESFGNLTINHVDDKGNVLKTQTAKYRAGNTYRAFPDSSILFDYNLVGTQGNTTGTVAANGNYTVTFTYSSAGVTSGYVNVSYVNSSGTAIKDPVKTRYRAGDAYDVPFEAIQGYQLDTTRYPANTKGTFTGETVNIQFVYKALDNTTSKVHYYNSNGWSSVRCYAYLDDGTQVQGTWETCPLMTNDSSMGSGWLVSNVSAPSARVMFHPTSGSDQEPGQGEDGYMVAGEAWIQNKVVTFSSKVITSHIDLKTGAKIADDVVNEVSKVKATDTYTTSPISGRTDVITPGNATGGYAPGVVNVVYLYGDSTVTPTTAPATTAPVTTAPVTTAPVTTAPVTTVPVTTVPVTTVPVVTRILVGDANSDGMVTISDATCIQRYLADLLTLDDNQIIAADCDDSGDVTVVDATMVQKYIAEMDDHGIVGTYKGGTEPETTIAPTTAPATTAPATTVPATTVAPTTAPPTTVPATTVAPTTAPTPAKRMVAFTNSQKWSGTIRCYYWSDANENMTTWPGAEMTYVATNDYQEAIYKFEVPSGATWLIFTNGSSQTVNVAYDGTVNGYYATSTLDSNWHHQVGTYDASQYLN